MRAVVQRVLNAGVTVDGECVGKIGRGYLVLLGVGHGDTRAEADKLWGKLRGLRINEDENGKTNLALADVDGEVLVVSQFTLFADCRHGRRPSFTDAGAPDVANELYEYFLTLVRQDVEHAAHGIFGARYESRPRQRRPIHHRPRYRQSVSSQISYLRVVATGCYSIRVLSILGVLSPF